MEVEKDFIEINNECDSEGNEIEGKYFVQLGGEPREVFNLDFEYFDDLVDAHSFAKEIRDETCVEITWSCLKPGWA